MKHAITTYGTGTMRVTSEFRRGHRRTRMVDVSNFAGYEVRTCLPQRRRDCHSWEVKWWRSLNRQVNRMVVGR